MQPEPSSASSEIVVEAAPVVAERPAGTLEIWGYDVPVAVAAGAGAAAGFAVVAAARRSRGRRVPRRGLFRRREKVVARRSFLVDVHVLGR